MEGGSYISCIKINGVPILPPMMTEDVREEMSTYKQIAIDVEKKLATLCVNKECKHYREDIQCKESVSGPKVNQFFFECKQNNVPTETFEVSNTDIGKAFQSNKQSDKEHRSEIEINLASSTVSRPESPVTSIDVNHCATEIIPTKFDNTDAKSEIWKPQVPKTLDIIPLTLSNSTCKEDEKYPENSSEDAAHTAKLVRQGSYVLDTPSPILLAHMQMELGGSTCTPCLEYVPTACTSMARRKEWNIAQGRIEWEHESKNREFSPQESQRRLSKRARNSPCCTNRKICKSITLQAKPKFSSAPCPSTRSVDCIQTMLAKEYMDRNNVQINHYKRHTRDKSSEKKRRFQKWKKCNSSSPLNSTHKLGRSMENLVSNDVPFSEYTKPDQSEIPVRNGSIKEISRNTEIRNSIFKLKSSSTSDKLLTVYKKVQETHKNQMAELVSRQQREQSLLQEEFEKQQLLLLNEIRKSFPEISVPFLSENILSPTFSRISPNSEKLPGNADNNIQYRKNLKNSLQEESTVEHLRDDSARKIPCPLDYIYPGMNCDGIESNSTKYLYLLETSKAESPCKINCPVRSAERKEMEMRAGSAENYEQKVIEERDGCKRSSVSRQLFPLDSKTTHVPILDKPIYETKHIEATNVINAYARGYIVRRLMRTERVIALKSTYKEALHCMLKLHVDAPLNRSEFNFLHRLQLQCDAASMNIVELFAQSPKKRMQVIAQDREMKQSRIERPTSARSYSFATQRTLARKKLKEMEEYPPSSFARSCTSRSRCQTWTSDVKEKLISPNILYDSIKRSTSAGTMRKPWR